jgi:hypothetical protein
MGSYWLKNNGELNQSKSNSEPDEFALLQGPVFLSG